MDASASALEANLELDRKELARVSKEAAEVENALAAAVREADAVLADKAINDRRIEVKHKKKNSDWPFHFNIGLIVCAKDPISFLSVRREC